MHPRRLAALAAAVITVLALSASAQDDSGSADAPPVTDPAPAADDSTAALQGQALQFAKDALLKLPIVKELIEKAKLSSCGDRCVQAERAGVTIYLFPSKGGTHALLVPKGSGLALAGSSDLVGKIFGDAKVPAAALVVSAADASIDTGSLGLPDALAKLLSDANGGDANLAVKKGAAAFAIVQAGSTGLLGKLAKVIGIVAQPVRLSGTIDSDALRAVFKKGSKGSRALTIVLPAATPMPFSKINDKSLFHLQTNSTRIALSGEEGTLKIDGSIDATVWIRGREMKMPITLAITKGGGSYEVAMKGAAQPPDGQDALGVGLPVKEITVSLSSAGAKKQKADTELQLGAKVTLNGRDLQAAVTLTAPGGKVSDVSVTITDGELSLADLPKLRSLPSAAEFRVARPTFGFHPKTKDAYLSGDLTWAKKSITAKMVVLIKEKPTASVTLLIDSPGISISQLAPNLKLPPEIASLLKLPKGLITLTTAKVRSAQKPSEMPLPAKAMLEAIAGSGGGGAEKLFPIPDGFALSGRLDPAKAPAKLQKILQKLGIKQPILLSGSIKGVLPPGGEPSISVTGDLATIELPADKQPKGFKLKSAAPKFFIAATKTKLGADVELGIETVLNLQVGKKDMPPLTGKVYARLSAAEQDIRFSGKMDGAWNDPLGLKGIVVADTVMGFGFSSTSQVHLALGGKAKFSPTADYEMAMILDITTGTGIPTPEKVGILFRAKEFNPLFPFILLEKMAASAATGPMGNSIKDAKLKAAFAKIANLKVSMGATHGKKLPLGLLKFTGVNGQMATLFLATPGVSDPDLPAFDGAGIKIIGAAVFNGHELGKMDAKLTATDGLEIHATIADFSLPKGKPVVSLKDAKLDLKAPVPGPGIKDGYFKMSGQSQILLYKGKVDIEIDAQMAKLEVENDWGEFGKAKITCASIGPLSHPEDFSLGLQLQMTGLKNVGKRLHAAVQKHAAEEKAKLAEKLNLPKSEAKLAADEKRLHEIKIKKHNTLKEDKEKAKLETDVAKQRTEIAGKKATYKADTLVWEAIDKVAKAGNISIDNFELVDARLKAAAQGAPITIKAKMTVMNKKIDGTFKLSLMKPSAMDLKELAKTVATHLEKELKPHRK